MIFLYLQCANWFDPNRFDCGPCAMKTGGQTDLQRPHQIGLGQNTRGLGGSRAEGRVTDPAGFDTDVAFAMRSLCVVLRPVLGL